MTNRREKRFSTKTKRALVAVLFFVITGVGLAFNVGTGTLSAFGWDWFSVLCPLGALESMLGSHSVILRALLCLAVVVALIVIFGKAFCSWVCPVPYIKDLFSRKKSQNNRSEVTRDAGSEPKESSEKAREAMVYEACAGVGRACGDSARKLQKREDCAAEVRADVAKTDDLTSRTADEDAVSLHGEDGKTRLPVDTRHAVLVGALASTAVFGFPVFCLICPVGLSFATFIVLWRFVQFNDFTWGILIFPTIIVLECVVLKKWCGKICPLGALISLVARLNVFFRPKRSKEKCLRSQGTHCEACVAVCPEHIDPFFGEKATPLAECTKCKTCSDACPVHAISFSFLPKREEACAAGDDLDGMK